MEKNTYTSFAPGRTTLNDHVDYWNGIGIGAALKEGITVRYTPTDGYGLAMKSDQMPGIFQRTIDSDAVRTGGIKWTDMVVGAFQYLEAAGLEVTGGKVDIISNIPMGGGVSSSAAMIVASMKAALMPFFKEGELDGKTAAYLFDRPGIGKVVNHVLTDVGGELDKSHNTHGVYARKLRKFFKTLNAETGLNYIVALLAHRVETKYVGASCGRLDQMSCALARPGEMLRINFDDLSFERLPALPKGFELIVVDSGQKHEVGDPNGPYYQRFQVPAKIFPKLGVASIDDIKDLGAALDKVKVEFPDHPEYLPWLTHAYKESKRGDAMADALQTGDMKTLADLMNKSHDSLSAQNSYNNSTALIDKLAKTVIGTEASPGPAMAARITGGGGGGSVVMLADAAHVEDVCRKVHAFRTNRESGVLTAKPPSAGISFVETPGDVLKKLNIAASGRVRG